MVKSQKLNTTYPWTTELLKTQEMCGIALAIGWYNQYMDVVDLWDQIVPAVFVDQAHGAV
jgi:hypothetical protein